MDFSISAFNSNTVTETGRINVEEEKVCFSVRIDDIIYLEFKNNLTLIHTIHETYTSARPMRYWIRELGDDHFFEVHRNYLVNFLYIKSIVNNTLGLHFSCTKIPISRHRIKQFEDAFFTYVRKNARYNSNSVAING